MKHKKMEKELSFKSISIKLILTENEIDVKNGLNYCSSPDSGANFLFLGTTRGLEKIVKDNDDGSHQEIEIKG